jgi:ABC-type lipoprotein export system ATPase subunit
LILGATGSGKTSFLNLLANIGKVNEAMDPNFLTQAKAVNLKEKEN